MSTVTETFQKASFEGKPFPMLRVSVRGAIRHYQHEFPHSPGAEIEKMGRKPYTVTMTAYFHDVPDSRLDEEFPNLYPQRLYELMRLFEEQTTGALVIPGLGTMQAVATDWRRTLDYAGPLSGEVVEFEFVEDVDRESVFESIEFGRGSLEKKYDELAIMVGGIYPFEPPSIFQTLNDVVTSVLAAQGVADAFSKVLEAKLLQIANLCSTIDRLAEFQDPRNHAAVTALKEVWLAATQMAEDILGRSSPIGTYRTGRVMSVAEASAAIFGDATHAMDLLQLNPIEDAFAIPAGMELRYYRGA